MSFTQRKPLFIYSYDPPSPPRLSEYDPPFPEEVLSPHNERNFLKFEFGKTDAAENNDRMVNSEVVDSTERLEIGFTESVNQICGKYFVDDNGCGTSVPLHLKRSSAHMYNYPNVITDQVTNKLIKLSSAEEDGTFSEASTIQLFSNGNCASSGNTDVTHCDNRISETVPATLESTSSHPAVVVYSAKMITSEETECAFSVISLCPRTTSESAENTVDSSVTQSSASKCNTADTSQDLSAEKETYMPTTDATFDRARCSSPRSTTYSISSLPSDTITMNLPFDSSYSDSELQALDRDDGTPGTTFRADDPLMQGISAPEVLPIVSSPVSSEITIDISTDSALASSSPVSPFLTESCTITPFPTDLATPYSTNPASTPLPSPVPSDIAVASASESTDTPSTPSTVTTSDLRCISRKLEDLVESTETKASCLITKSCGYNDTDRYNICKIQNNLYEAANGTSNASASQGSRVFQLVSRYETENFKRKDIKDSGKITAGNEDKSSDNEITVNDIDKSAYSVAGTVVMHSHSATFCQKQSSEASEAQCDILTCNKEKPTTCSYSVTKGHLQVKEPPLPPRRLDSCLIIAPPLPPPPVEDNNDEVIPPVPKLPEEFASSSPMPPVRHYLLIPLDPHRRTPIAFGPPVIPPRSSSLTRTPTSPFLSESSTPEFSDLCTELAPETEELNKFFVRDASQCVRRDSGFIRTLTPVPEERSSPMQNLSSSDEIKVTENNDTVQDDIRDHKEDSDILTELAVVKKSTIKEPACISLRPNDQKCTPPPLPPKPPALKLSAFSPPLTPPPPPRRSLILSSTPLAKVNSPSLETVTDSTNRTALYPTGTTTMSEVTKQDTSQSVLPAPPTPPPLPSVMASDVRNPVMSVSKYGKLVINRTDLPQPLPEEEVRRAYTNSMAWGWLLPDKDTVAIYSQVRSIIQQGPQCGLVALSMASQLCSSSVSVEVLLEKAQAQGFSSHGEMFSAESMKSLANDSIQGIEATVNTDVLNDPSLMVRLLTDGDLILVPYDAEHNHLPGLHRGRKAHWGLICGCLMQGGSLNLHAETCAGKLDFQLDQLWHFRPRATVRPSNRPSSVPPALSLCSQQQQENIRCSRSVSPNVYASSSITGVTSHGADWCHSSVSKLVILWRQGKSRNLIFSPIEELRKSNEQLAEYQFHSDYVIENVEKGLSCQVVVLHKVREGLSDLLCSLRQN